MTSLTQFCGGDDPLEYLRQLAAWVRTPLGLQAERALNRLIEDLEESDARCQLTLRDLHRDIESLEAELKQYRGW